MSHDILVVDLVIGIANTADAMINCAEFVMQHVTFGPPRTVLYLNSITVLLVNVQVTSYSIAFILLFS
jgi:hypothetical protein